MNEGGATEKTVTSREVTTSQKTYTDAVPRYEFDRLREDHNELRTEHDQLQHLVTGGMNIETGLLEGGIAQQMSDFIRELKQTRADFASLIANVRGWANLAGRGVIIILGMIGSTVAAFVTWTLTHFNSVPTVHLP